MTGCIGAVQGRSHAEHGQQTSQAKGTVLTAAVTGKDTQALLSTRCAKQRSVVSLMAAAKERRHRPQDSVFTGARFKFLLGFILKNTVFDCCGGIKNMYIL